MRSLGTKDKILVEGRSLLQKHGYNGFSFQNIADKLGIKKPSLYDHFSSKDELITGILLQYTQQFDDWTVKVAAAPPLTRVRKVFDVFHLFVSDNRKICPVLALSTDFQEMSKEIQKQMQAFIDHWLNWLEAQIKEGQKSGDIRKDLSAKALADFVYSQGIGAQVQARIRNQPELTSVSGEMIVRFLES